MRITTRQNSAIQYETASVVGELLGNETKNIQVIGERTKKNCCFLAKKILGFLRFLVKIIVQLVECLRSRAPMGQMIFGPLFDFNRCKFDPHFGPTHFT